MLDLVIMEGEKKMIRLKEGDVCPFSSNCPYISEGLNLTCQGTNKNRKGEFVCLYVDKEGNFVEKGKYRTGSDITGQMEILHG
jgi:hypothetical protein